MAVRKKAKTEAHGLLAQLDALPPETRKGIVRFVQLIVSLEIEPRDPAADRSEQALKDLCELRRILETRLQVGPPARRGLVREVFACVEKAYELGQEDSATLLLQTGIVIAAGDEKLASFIVQNAAYSAALDMVRAATR